MDPLIATIAAILMQSLPALLSKKETLSSEEKEKKIAEAKQEYDAQPLQQNSTLENKRSQILERLTQLQTDVRLFVPDQPTLEKLLSILSDQIIQAYKAKTDGDIRLVDLSLEPVAKEAEEYKKAYNSRGLARKLALFVPASALIFLIIILVMGTIIGKPDVNTVIPIIQIPLPVLLWSTIGSLVAILYRFNKSGDAELEDPLRWVFTRPLTGIVMGSISYFVILAGLLAIAPKGTSPETTNIASSGIPELFWIIAFITSFSDRFADTILKSLFGRFGGEPQKEFVSSNIKSLSSYLQSLTEISQNTSKDAVSSPETVNLGAISTTLQASVQNMDKQAINDLMLQLLSALQSQSSKSSSNETLLDSPKSKAEINPNIPETDEET